MIIEIHRARPEDEPTLRHLMQLLLYDRSEFDGTDVDEQGSFGYDWLGHYWIEDGRHPFVVRVGRPIAGFVLVHELEKASVSGADEPLHSIAELFILRRYRRRGVGRVVARRMFDMFPGRWSVRERDANAPARAFWSSVIAEYTRGHFDEQRERSDAFRGAVQQFHSRHPQ
jgi:predicted acetyltransferase